MEAIDEIVAEFLVESHENLDQLDTDLLALEQDPTSRDLLGSVFRTIHTIKGTSGFLAFHRLEQLTHVGENLLSRLRDGKIQLNEQRTSALLSMVDAVRGLLGEIERTGVEGDADHTELASRLAALLEGDAPQASVPDQAAEEPESAPVKVKAAVKTVAAKPAPVEPAPVEAVVAAAVEVEVEVAVPVAVTVPATPPVSAASTPSRPSSPNPVSPPIGDVLVESGSASRDEVEFAGIQQGMGDERKLGEILVGNGAATVDAVDGALRSQAQGHGPEGRRSVVESSVRVDVELLDTLMRMVGELVLSRNQLVSELEDQKDTALARSAQRLSLVTSELQEQVMKTRMQPVDTVWSKLPRVVRDLSRQCGRQVRLEMEGRDTELDRSVLEAIKDPLTHLVRNAIDHGIEPPEARVAAGKEAEGTLLLRAYHEAGQVHLEIVDNGAGIDPRIIAAKALERGLASVAELERMSPREVIQLIFLPGFSTAGTVTNVSGRGVGMDVVKTRIEGIGGSVDVISNKGTGSTFRLTIPLTLAIIPALTIGCAGRRYAIPQVSVLELVRLAGEHARGGIEHISGAPVYRLRGTLLPLVRLDEQLGLVPVDTAELHGNAQPGTAADEAPRDESHATEDARGGFIVVLQAEQHRFGLVVDDVLDTQEIVVKPLGRHLKGLPMYAGATILGDGSVVLILDATTVARRADVLASTAGAASTGAHEESTAIDPVLVVELAGGRQAAIPLDMVTRLEEIPQASIEKVGGREVVQYRGHIMPMVRLANLLGAYGEDEASDRVQLVVYTRGERSVGFAVERIIDIATERSGSRSDIDDHALLGSVVVGERVVELLDVQAAVLAADPVFYQEAS
ncbi:MAG TPA: chemotaxis protein CheW [Kineosporiaceae bacterium]|nr:chemotaxis protein CheW [Kineosporiaceae bacterium]